MGSGSRPGTPTSQKSEVAMTTVSDVSKLTIGARPEDAPVQNERGEVEFEFYVHYIEFNKRLDEWVSGTRARLDKPVTFPKKKNKASHRRESPLGTVPQTPEHIRHDDAAYTAPQGTDGTFSKEKEIEKLRTQGSMTQSSGEVARMKNLNIIEMGEFQVEPWYFSPYPTETAYVPILYICEFCLCYYTNHKQYERHRTKCTLQHPPGNEIYRKDDISFFEIDGRRQKMYCRNLCLLSKCFLDHKTLYYRCRPRDERGCHIIGYFSKEKESADNYNLACILTLPQYQRMGYGRVLMQFSYELSKAEGKEGSPEKPLYRAFWSEVLVELLVGFDGEISIDDLSNMTSFTTQDILHALFSLDAIRERVIEQYERFKKKKLRRIDPTCLKWTPKVFSQAELRYL
ncbi:hypothetical protein DL89DRAFT_274736 [Linderina pennispora]|uniref:Histone acetyltransferase ESA1 n=1 Tax=Linderina pennispora TaxID=61395 RepID=A0A1Y1WC39_9FUNG|nr:uncharacterized protein DL89DRAFT_274736 [Linderina pennispora]ORX70935.1 hypothetical protein DL89DRAFT_274736 [Linderina pennispora]